MNKEILQQMSNVAMVAFDPLEYRIFERLIEDCRFYGLRMFTYKVSKELKANVFPFMDNTVLQTQIEHCDKLEDLTVRLIEEMKDKWGKAD